ncbi:MAG: 1,4-alpha-glucan branching protein GlgB [Defluviitaleaceae bacterium]|nr:1,4-alpha-glucan branching protein GlgB [Defluviitaleaceae bacterium]MCL2239012.1 1,4-alpha-glucan branching protein GlgB [Defluviitaleaceae bacterium]
MISTNMHELMQVVEGNHADPHHILGMHEATIGKKTHTLVRVFNPEAKEVAVIGKDGTRHPMKLEHRAGFFTAQLPKTAHFHYKLAYTGHDGQQWEAWDPYAFAPLVSEFDLHLFGQGTHYKIYEKLGAHPMTVEGIDGVLFAVWAPNAKRISVVGDFNTWNGLRHPMRSMGPSGVWELFIPGLANYDKYKFELKLPSGDILLKSDPYASFAELRPGTASMVYDINGYTWGDGEWLKNRTRKNPLDGPMNVYEFHPGSWKRVEHDHYRFLSWPELTAELIPYVQDMGYTHVEIMGVSEFPFDGSWGYQVTGYYAPTSRYGNPHQFMAFVDACHRAGIGVILDWVPAHFPKDAHGLALFDGTRLYEHEDPRQGEHPDWGTLIFNYGRNEVKNFLIANALYWVEKFHIDGLRVDAVASMLYLDYGKNYGQWVPNRYGGRENIDAVEFMKHMNSVLLGAHPHVLMIAEESTAWTGVTRPAAEDGLGFSLKWNMGWMNDFLTYMTKDSIYRKHHHHNLTFGMVYAYSEKYILVLSHDEVVHGKGSMVNKMPGDLWQKMANLRAAYGFMMGHPGKKLLFMGGEFAQFDEWGENRSLNWFLLDQYEHHRQMHRFVKDLNHLYLKERACWQNDFHGGGFHWLNCNDYQRSLISFYRVTEKKRRTKAEQEALGPAYEYLIFVCNFTPVPHVDYRVGLPAPGKYKEILNSDDVKYGGGGIVNPGPLISDEFLCDGRQHSLHMKLPPLAVVVLKGVV